MHERPHVVRQIRPWCLSEKLTFGASSNCEYEFVATVYKYSSAIVHEQEKLALHYFPYNDKHIKAIENYHYILLIFPNLLYTELRII